MSQELKNLLKLIKIEKEEDQRQYQNLVVLTPLKERKQKGVSWYPIKITHTEIGAGENFYLTLEKEKDDLNSVFQVGSMVSLFHNSRLKSENSQISGVIASLWKNRMRVAFGVEELPDWIDSPELGIDLLFDALTYKEMEAAVEKVISAKEGRLADLKKIFAGTKSAEFLEEIPSYYYVKSLNDSQNAALKKILSAQDIALIHGPPGTGKTTTLVDAVKLTLQNEKQVLVTAPSNNAVDLLTKRLAYKGLDILRIGNPARIDEDLVQYSLENKIATHNDYNFLKKLRKQAEETRKYAQKYKRKFGDAERAERRRLYKEAAEISHQALVLEKYIIDSLVNEAQVITATLVGSVNRYIRNKQFSTVFIDEAGQALEPACWIPITKAERVVLAGDHWQLPPTVKSMEAEKAGLSETLFEKAMQRQKASQMLKVQYRMNEKIMGFSNQMFYENELIADESVKNHSLSSFSEDAIFAQAVEFIDTAGTGFSEITHPETLSKLNEEEANLLFKHLTKTIQYFDENRREVFDTDFSIGIVSPYKAQVKLLRELLYNQPDLQDFLPYIQVNTIDGFQGQEREVIYISLVRSNDEGKIGFLADTRRMNVALTRARKKLVVIGDSATIAQSKFYSQFLDYIDKINAYKTAWEFLN